MATIGSLNVKIGVNLNEFESGMRKLDKQLLDIEKQFKGSFWTGKRFEAMGKKLTAAVTVPLAGMGAAAAKASIDLESAFAGVEKTVKGTDAELAALRQGFDDLSTRIPIATTEIYGIGEAAGQLGIEKQYILGFTEVMAKLGSTTNLSSTEAATSLARLANITQMPKDQFDRLGATVVALDGSLATTASEIVNMGLRLAGAGNVAGMTEADILSLSGALSSVGVEAQAGGSAFSKIILEINNEVLSSGENLQSFAAIAGMTADEFAQAWQENASQALVAFIQGLGEMQEQGQNIVPVLDELGFSELRVRDALLRAAGAGDLFTEALEVGSTAWEENMALNEAAEKRYQTLAAQIQMLKNSLTLLAGSFGDILTPAIGGAVEWVKNLTQTLMNLDEGKKKLIITIATLAASIGPLLWIMGALLKQTSNLKIGLDIAKGAVQNLGKALAWLQANPIAIVIIAIAALTAWAIKMVGGWENAKKAMVDIWNIMAAGASNMALSIMKAWNRMKLHIQQVVVDILNAAEPLISKLPKAISGGFDELAQNARASLKQTEDNIAGLEKTMSENSKKIGSSVNDIKTMISDASAKTKEAAASTSMDISAFSQDISDEMAGLAETVGTNIDVAGTAFDNLGGKAGKAAGSVGESTKKIAEDTKETATKIREEFDAVTRELDLSMQIARAQFELLKAQMGENADQAIILEAELNMLNIQYEKQQEKVNAAQKAYEDMKQTKTETAEETRKLQLALLEEQKALLGLQGEIDKTTKAYQNATSAKEQFYNTYFESKSYRTSSGGSGGSKKEKWVTYQDSDGKWKSESKSDYDKRESDWRKENDSKIRETAREHNVDMGVARDIVRKEEKTGKKAYHDGGWVGKPSNLRFDELVGKLQHGEFVLSRAMVDSFASMLEMFSDLFDSMKGVSMPSIPKPPQIDNSGIDYDRLGRAIAKHSKPNVIMNNEYNSPDPLTPSSINRKNEQLMRKLALEWGM